MATTNTPLGWSATTSDDWIQISVDNVNWSRNITNQSGDKPIYVKVTPGGNGDETGTIIIDCLDCESDPRQQIVNVQRCGCTGGTTTIEWIQPKPVNVDACATKATVGITGTKTRTYDNCPGTVDTIAVSDTATYSFKPNATNQEYTIPDLYYGGGPNENKVQVTVVQGAGPCSPGNCDCDVVSTVSNVTIPSNNTTNAFNIFTLPPYNSETEEYDCIVSFGEIEYDNYEDDYTTGFTKDKKYIYIKAKGENTGSEKNFNVTLPFYVIGSDDECTKTTHVIHNGSGAQDDCRCNNSDKLSVHVGDVIFDSIDKSQSSAKPIAEIIDSQCITVVDVQFHSDNSDKVHFAWGIDAAGHVNVWPTDANTTTNAQRKVQAEIIYNAGSSQGCTKFVTVIQKPKDAPAKCYNIEVVNESEITCQGGTITIKANSSVPQEGDNTTPNI